MRKRTIALLLAGALCLAAAVGLTGYNLWDEQRASLSVESGVEQLRAAIQPKDAEKQPLLPEEQVVMPTITLPEDGRNYIGLLEVPVLGLSLPVLDQCTEGLLRAAPCLYQGNLYDGMIIAGHNYRSHFKNLSQLAAGDQVRFTDVEGNVWSYTVVTTEIINGYDVEAMESGDWDLTLFTCTYGGKERVTVRCTMDIQVSAGC